MRNQGYSLVELIAVLAIVAILVGLAMPSYLLHTQRTRRTEAANMLQTIAIAQEKFYIQHNNYASSLTSPAPDGLGIDTSTLADYALSLVSHPRGWQLGFTIIATTNADGRQTSDERCTHLSLNEQGRRGASDDRNRDTSSHCW